MPDEGVGNHALELSNYVDGVVIPRGLRQKKQAGAAGRHDESVCSKETLMCAVVVGEKVAAAGQTCISYQYIVYLVGEKLINSLNYSSLC